jgi:ABC-type branched-subunit amino acid transport system substrate-binding protein
VTSDRFKQPPNKRRRWTVGLVLTVVVLVAGTVAAFAAVRVVHTCGSIHSGITKTGGECIGLTDGSFDFDPQLTTVDKLIKKENDRVAKDGHNYAKVVLLDPLDWNSTSPMSHAEVVHSVEGAYVAQLVENKTLSAGIQEPPNEGEQYPEVQLILANEGSHETHWQPVVQKIISEASGPHPVIGVIGLGVSLQETEDAAKMLSAKSIPMVGSALSADGLDSSTIQGLLNVSPGNAEYVAALAKYLNTRPDVTSAMLVADSNNDLYTKTLRTDFEKQFRAPSTVTAPDGKKTRRPPLLTTPVQYFTGQTVGARSQPGLFAYTIQNICSQNPDVVFFAGRLPDLQTFLAELDERTCPTQPIVIMTGATGTTSAVLTQKDLATKISMIYSTSDASENWAASLSGAPAGFAPFLQNFTTVFAPKDPNHPAADLDDGYAIMTNDAMRTLARALKISIKPDQVENQTASPADVFEQERNLSGVTGEVPGASGTLSFSDANDGRAGGRTVPVLASTPDGGAQIVKMSPYTTPIA